MAHAVAVPSPSSAMKRRRKEEVYRLAYINCIKPVPFRNIQNMPANGCLEEKSIADLIAEQKNPFEVVRKPPKKRKKVEESCFVNEALNLSQPEKQFNPFEVPRAAPADFEQENHAFVNPALNLKAPDHQVLNPFEIVRCPEEEAIPMQEEPRALVGIENPALEIKKKLPIAIAVPFTPTINHRIDFGQLKTPEPPSQAQRNDTNDQLTPSEMLSKKLVFSPKEQNCGTPKRLFAKSLSMISEEATVDIDEELDCYQLQLENSINEAKLNNRKYFTDIRKDVLKKTVTNTKQEISTALATKEVVVKADQPQPEACVVEVVEPKREVEDDTEEVDEDSFDDDLNIDNGNYQPFKRAYVGPATSQPKIVARGLMPPPPLTTTGTLETKSKTEHDGLKGMIRRSIRMITKPKNKKTTSKEDASAAQNEGIAIMSSIRRSLRKRKERPEDYPAADLLDMSVIIDGSRSVFKDPAVPKVFRAGPLSASLTSSNQSVEKTAAIPATTSMLRNSIRRGKNNLMKNILHKKVEDYNFD